MKTLREALEDAERRRVAVGHFNSTRIKVIGKRPEKEDLPRMVEVTDRLQFQMAMVG